MIGQRDGRRSVLGRSAAKAIDPAGAVEQRILRVDVQMDELTHGQDSWTFTLSDADEPVPPRKEAIACNSSHISFSTGVAKKH